MRYTVTFGRVKNLGNYETARVELTEEYDDEDTPRDAAYDDVRGWVMRKIKEEPSTPASTPAPTEPAGAYDEDEDRKFAEEAQDENFGKGILTDGGKRILREQQARLQEQQARAKKDSGAHLSGEPPQVDADLGWKRFKSGKGDWAFVKNNNHAEGQRLADFLERGHTVVQMMGQLYDAKISKDGKFFNRFVHGER